MPSILAWLGSALLTFGSFVAVITVVVFFHELGHLLVGRWRGVKPEKFSIGFGPRLFGFMVGETEVRVSLLPFGGYVKFAGDNPLEEPKPEDQGRGFYQATPVSRGLIAVAGPVANFILAFFIFFAVFMAPQNSLAPIVGFVKPGSPAAVAGILPRDKIVSVDGLPVQGFFDVQEKIVKSPGRALDLGLERDGKTLSVSVTPISVDEKNVIETEKQGRIGISASPRAPVLALLDPEAAAGKAGLKTFDRITKLDGQPVGNYEELIARLANLLSQPPAATGNPTVAHSLEGTRPRAVEAPGATVWAQEPIALSLLVTPLGRAVAPGEVDALLGLACADLNLYVVQPGSAAEAAGLQRGDRMLSVDGKNVLWWSDEVETERLARGLEPMHVTVLRDGKKLELTVKQFAKKQRDEAGIRVEVPELGAAPDYRILSGEPQWIKIRYSFAQALARAGKETVGATRLIALGLAGMVSGKISSDAIGGPLMIADVARKAAGYGLAALAAVTASISVNLGLMNLLPLPVLDGFHVFSAILEKIRRRPLPIKVIEIANLVGIAMLLVLMAFAFRNDLARKFFE
jgi:regulator of sigma E protease